MENEQVLLEEKIKMGSFEENESGDSWKQLENNPKAWQNQPGHLFGHKGNHSLPRAGDETCCSQTTHASVRDLPSIGKVVFNTNIFN